LVKLTTVVAEYEAVGSQDYGQRPESDMSVCACGAEMDGGTEADMSDLGQTGGSVCPGRDNCKGLYLVCGIVMVDLGLSAGVSSRIWYL